MKRKTKRPAALVKQQTYFQKLEEIIHDLPAVARIWSSWDSNRSHQPFHWPFSLDFQECRENKRQTLFRPFTSWRLRTARNAREERPQHIVGNFARTLCALSANVRKEVQFIETELRKADHTVGVDCYA